MYTHIQIVRLGETQRAKNVIYAQTVGLDGRLQNCFRKFSLYPTGTSWQRHFRYGRWGTFQDAGCNVVRIGGCISDSFAQCPSAQSVVWLKMCIRPELVDDAIFGVEHWHWDLHILKFRISYFSAEPENGRFYHCDGFRFWPHFQGQKAGTLTTCNGEEIRVLQLRF